MTIRIRIKNDLKESQIDWRVIIAFVPIAFLTYIFHEFGHWTFGELLGNDMTLSLNNSSPSEGYFNNDTSALWSAVGGPVFTILQGLIFLFLTWLTKSIYAYSVAFFAVFSRFFSIIFGGINLQDEARIATMLNWNKYLIAAIVLTMLFLILWKSNRIMKLNKKAVGYFTVLGVFAILLVIGVNKFL
jgi:magnesium-transporting ATPase (P-type)